MPSFHLYIFPCASRPARLVRRCSRAQGFHPRTLTAESCPPEAFKNHARPRLVGRYCGTSRLLGLVDLSTQARSGRAAEVTAERRGQERAENDFGTPIALLDESPGAIDCKRGTLYIPEGGEGEPQQEDELEGVVEGEPVDNAEQALQDAAQICQSLFFSGRRRYEYLREEREDNPVLWQMG